MGTFNSLKLVYLAGVLWFLGCPSPGQEPPQRLAHAHAPEAPVVCPTVQEVLPRWVVVIIWDRSGSVQQSAHDQIGRIRTDAMALIERLQPGSLVIGHHIAEHSYRDDEIFLRDAIPAAPAAAPCEITNLWDVRQKKTCRQQEHRHTAQLACVMAARQRIVRILQELTPARATRTDVWGAMIVTSEIMQAYPHSHLLLVVYSDLEDNVWTRQHPGTTKAQHTAQALLPALPGLQGATVIIRTPRTDPTAAARHIGAFQRHLTNWGASVSVVPFEVVPWANMLSDNS